jgi:iron complex outermembrane receptor protein
MAFQLRALQVALLGVLGSGLAVVSAPVFAQAAGEQLERIEVTGSNIKRTDTESVNPVQVITRKDIERSGQPTTADLIRTLSANSQSLNETFTNSFSPGASGAGLRGLSQKNTLVLLNGRRVANYGFAQNLQDTYADLNAIPIAAVERIEVLRDGASAIYGSDAIAGVINIILRKDYQGGEVGGDYGRAYAGGGAEKQGYALIGFGAPGVDRYNFMIAADYFKRDLTRFSDRDYINNEDFRRFGGLNNNSASAGTFQRATSANPNRVPFSTCGATGFPGTVQPISNFSTTLTGSACAYNPAPFLTLFPESKREQMVGNGTFDILPNLQVFTDLTYSHNDSFQAFTPGSFTTASVAFSAATGAKSIPATLPVGNPNNPFTVPTNFAYTFFDVGPRDSQIVSNFSREVIGLRGSLGKFDWEAAGFHSESRDVQTNFNGINAIVLQQVLANGTYSFLNPASTPAVTNALRLNTQRRSVSKLDGADAHVTGELFNLPAGPLGFAAGVDFRREAINDNPDALLTRGQVLGLGSTQTNGSRRDTAGYVELNVPLIRTLEASVAVREDHYSDFGNAFSPKVGLKWKPIPELLLRATASKGFRAPSLPEISPSAASFFTTVTDAQAPGGPANVNVAGVFAGNPKLEAEKSKNYNAGFVLSPDSTSSIGIDFYSIEQKNLINSDSFQFIVDNPTLFPGQVIRDSLGNILSVNSGYRNLTALRTMGFDLDFSKSISIAPVGKFTLAGNATYIQRFKFQPAAGEPLLDSAGNNNFGPLPRVKATTSLTWEYQAFTTSLSYIYIGDYSQENTPLPQARVGEYRQYDLYLSWEGIKNLKLYFAVLNLADKHPPFDASTGSLPFDFSQYDARGRFFRGGLTYKFL